MIIFREHPIFFLGLKYVQLLFSILVVVFEMTQYVYYGKHYALPNQRNDWFEKVQDVGDSNGELKIWVLVVCGLTTLSLVFNLAFFRKYWDKGTNVWLEILFTALWLSAGLSNLDPVYRGSNFLNCRSPSLEEHSPKQFICNVWVTSLIFGWFIFGTFILSTFISWQLSKEIKQNIQWIGRSSHSDSCNNKINDRKSFVSSPTPQPIVNIPIQNDSLDEELEKGGVPELLLQSGLPADHRMSLKIVLPQSGPFGQGQDEQDEQDEQQQQQGQINNGLTPSPPAQVNASTLTLPDVKQHETNLLVVPSKKSTEVTSLHEVPL